MNLNIDAQCDRIVQKLKAAAAADPAFAVFGANRHRYVIGPSVSEAQVRAFETAHGIALPEPYAAFLRRIGNGSTEDGSYYGSAAGPFYGIYPLGFGLDDFLEYKDGCLATLPFVRPDMPASEWQEATRLFDDENVSDDDFDEACRRLYGGLLPIGSQGCQSYHALVLQGPYAGRIVNIDTERSPPVFAFEANFLDWYERWLDEILSGILLKDGPNWFAYTMGGDDAHLLKVFNTADQTSEKLAALGGFRKLRSISAKSADEVAKIAASDDPELRRDAVLILAEFAYAQARAPLHDLLNGPEADQLTACSAIHWFAKDHAVDWVDRVGPICARTGDIELFRHASYILQSSGRDCSAYLVPAASHPDEAIRAQAIYALGKGVQTSQAIDAILTALTDVSPKVVHTALQAHQKAFDDRFIAAYAAIARRFEVDENYIQVNLRHRLKAIGYDAIPAFLAAFDRGKVRTGGFWSRLLGRQNRMQVR